MRVCVCMFVSDCVLVFDSKAPLLGEPASQTNNILRHLWGPMIYIMHSLITTNLTPSATFILTYPRLTSLNQVVILT